MKLCVFLNGPLNTQLDKGAIFPNYHNYGDLFDEVHFISPAERDVDPADARVLCVNASAHIHCIGRPNIFRHRRMVPKVVEIIKKIGPDAIRAYDPMYMGWLAAKCARKLDIPLWVSLGTQYDGGRKFERSQNFKKYLVYKYTGWFTEPYVLKSADRVTIGYRCIAPYVERHLHETPDIIYVGANLEQFAGGTKVETLPSPLVISVGRLHPVKNHDILIRSMKEVDAHLCIIGSGPEFPKLARIAEEEGVRDRVTFIMKVEHDRLRDYLRSADVFALAYNTYVENIPASVMEAMAAGLPVVAPLQEVEESAEFTEAVVQADKNPRSFAEKINTLLADGALRERHGRLSLGVAKAFDLKLTVSGEAKVYAELLAGHRAPNPRQRQA